jgi:hypothetical protein
LSFSGCATIGPATIARDRFDYTAAIAESWKRMMLLNIRSSQEKPNDAFVKVHYRDHWFYIDDRDFRSKRMFSFLLFLFTLAETEAPKKAPMITIPAN